MPLGFKRTDCLQVWPVGQRPHGRQRHQKEGRVPTEQSWPSSPGPCALLSGELSLLRASALVLGSNASQCLSLTGLGWLAPLGYMPDDTALVSASEA